MKKPSANDTINAAREAKKNKIFQEKKDAWEAEVASITEEKLEDIASHPENYSEEELEKIEAITDYIWQQNTKLNYYFPISTFLLDLFVGTHFFLKYNPSWEEKKENREKENNQVDLTMQPNFASVAGVSGIVVIIAMIFFSPVLMVELPIIAPAMFIYLRYMDKWGKKDIDKKVKAAIFAGIAVVWFAEFYFGLALLLVGISHAPEGALTGFIIASSILAYLLKPTKPKQKR